MYDHEYALLILLKTQIQLGEGLEVNLEVIENIDDNFFPFWVSDVVDADGDYSMLVFLMNGKQDI